MVGQNFFVGEDGALQIVMVSSPAPVVYRISIPPDLSSRTVMRAGLMWPRDFLGTFGRMEALCRAFAAT